MKENIIKELFGNMDIREWNKMLILSEPRATYKQCELRDVDYLISEDDCSQIFKGYSEKLILL